MAEMDAIEITHRHHGPLGDRGLLGGVADDHKTGRHFGHSLKDFRLTGFAGGTVT